MFESVAAPIKTELNLFENKLRDIIESQDNFLKEDLIKFVFSDAKRLRVIFIFLFAKILKLDCDDIFKIALGVEILHNASLIHDDIIDDEKTRRNLETFNSKFNSKLALLEGDLLFALALQVLSATNPDVLKIFSKRVILTINGEIKQNENINKKIPLQDYFEKTFNKTGNLFMAGLEALFTMGDCNIEIKNALSDFMKNYSIAFQIKNDINDIKTDKSDIKNGNYTLSVLYFFMENEQIFKNSDFSKYISKALKKVEEFLNLAQKSLNKIPNSIYKNSLVEICSITLRS